MPFDSPAPRDFSTPRHDWTLEEVEALFELPFTELVFRAAETHRRWFDPAEVQISQLLSVKTGGCAENCGYCSQSASFDTGVDASKLMEVQRVLADAAQAKALRDAGLDYYNHNLDTSPEYYDKVVTTRTYQERLDTLEHVRAAGMSTCCGGIIGMGETRRDRAGLLHALATLPAHPDSLPINDLMPVKGTPLGGSEPVDGLEFVRTIAVARIVCPKSMVRLSAGREHMSREQQALCFLAGANSIFIGAKLLTTANPGEDEDTALLADLGMRPMGSSPTQVGEVA